MSATALALPVRPVRAPRPVRAVRSRPCSAPRAVRPLRAPVRPLRLTRRGRLTVTCTAATLLTGAVVAVTGALSGASAGVERTPPPAVVTVLPGQTLSQLAGDWSPSADWRAVANDIVQLNALPSMTLQAGQRLTMPERD